MDFWNVVSWVGIASTGVALGWIFWSARGGPRSGADLTEIFSDPGGYPGGE